jgi:hypothetical protein
LGRRNKKSAGQVISELARQALTNPNPGITKDEYAMNGDGNGRRSGSKKRIRPERLTASRQTIICLKLTVCSAAVRPHALATISYRNI